MSEPAKVTQPGVVASQVAPGAIGTVVETGQVFIRTFGGFALIDDANAQALNDNLANYTFAVAPAGSKLTKVI